MGLAHTLAKTIRSEETLFLKSHDYFRQHLDTALRSCESLGKITASERRAIYESYYGLCWGISTGRTSGELVQELEALTPWMTLRLLCVLWLKGVTTSGVAWDVIYRHRGHLRRLALSA